MPLALLIDEDTRSGALWDAIERHNAENPEEPIDAIRVGDPGAPALGTLDPEVIAWAARAGRIVVSRDANTLIAEHVDFVDRGFETPGVLIVRKGHSIPELVEYLVLICNVGRPEEFACRSLFIPL